MSARTHELTSYNLKLIITDTSCVLCVILAYVLYMCQFSKLPCSTMKVSTIIILFTDDASETQEQNDNKKTRFFSGFSFKATFKLNVT